MLRKMLTLALLLSIAPSAALADSHEEVVVAPAWIDLLRDDLRDDRAKLVEIAMDLHGGDLVTLRRIYSEYEASAAAIGDRKVTQILRYAKAYPEVSPELADELAKEALSIQSDVVKLRKKTWKSVRKELGASNGARFLQVETQITNLIDLQIASQLPLIHTLGKPTEEGYEKPGMDD